MELKYLEYLDLSQNDFKGIIIPSFLGSVYNLRYLNLSGAGFVGGESLQWVSHLSSSLRLQELDLYSNKLTGEITGFLGKIPGTLGNMSSLESLDFSVNQISGVILTACQVNISELLNLSTTACLEKYLQVPSFKVSVNSAIRNFDIYYNNFCIATIISVSPTLIFALLQQICIRAMINPGFEMYAEALMIAKLEMTATEAVTLMLGGGLHVGAVPQETRAELGFHVWHHYQPVKSHPPIQGISCEPSIKSFRVPELTMRSLEQKLLHFEGMRMSTYLDQAPSHASLDSPVISFGNLVEGHHTLKHLTTYSDQAASDASLDPPVIRWAT
ncbi:hypothetical protein GIB67_017646 [Kingdonia uniflora]|uniref:Uncharacterized protein n=1 Tax=Kingdonia uniflora TaxID=39325 RepID=A0A7J7P443_9MAGN|nr:hypothetical protein GIB67_017646 [Kingdonia uniflora]